MHATPGPRYSSSTRAWVIYNATVAFTVDLDREQVEDVELYADSLEHLDTGLSSGIVDWRRLHEQARAIVEANVRASHPHWSE